MKGAPSDDFDFDGAHAAWDPGACGSVSKTITALAVLKLRHQGKVVLDVRSTALRLTLSPA
jgi:hypothetical protein